MMAPSGLRRPAALAVELVRTKHPSVDELVDGVGRALVAGGLLRRAVPLGDLHRYLPADALELDEHYMNAPTRELYRHGEALRPAYQAAVRLVADRLDADLLFQGAPVVRFHPPARFPPNLRGASGAGLQLHSDTMGGHPFAMLNVWISLTDAWAGAALHLADRASSVALIEHFCATTPGADYGSSLAAFHARVGRDAGFEAALRAACRARPSGPGDVFVFDPRCLHGGVEHHLDTTRVSIDFRVVPLPERGGTRFEADLAEAAPRWRRGDVLHPRRARELGR